MLWILAEFGANLTLVIPLETNNGDCGWDVPPVGLMLYMKRQKSAVEEFIGIKGKESMTLSLVVLLVVEHDVSQSTVNSMLSLTTEF